MCLRRLQAHFKENWLGRKLWSSRVVEYVVASEFVDHRFELHWYGCTCYKAIVILYGLNMTGFIPRSIMQDCKLTSQYIYF